MANYSADIRVGIVGKNQLNSLEAQLKRVNTQVNKLNKALVLKTRAQTIKLKYEGRIFGDKEARRSNQPAWPDRHGQPAD